MVAEVRLHDGHDIAVEVHGDGPTVLLPVDPRPVEGPQADEMRKWGADPSLGYSLIEGLRDDFRVVAFDYQGHVLETPKPETLTPANVVRDIIAVADAVGADRFAYYGYSWLALIGLQLATRTDRLSALVMGGFPPLDGPYTEMLQVTTASYKMAVEAETPSGQVKEVGDDEWSSSLSRAQTRQFVTLYEALRDFDDRAVQGDIGCPRLCFVGSADEIVYDGKWGGVRVDLAGPVLKGRTELEALGWAVRVHDGLDHMGAMRPEHVLPMLRPWLISQLVPRT